MSKSARPPRPKARRTSTPRTARSIPAPRKEDSSVSTEARRSFQVLSDAHTRMSDRVVLLSKLLHLFADPMNVERDMERVVDLALEAIPCEAASVMLVDREKGDMFFQSTRGPVAVEVKQYRVPIGMGLAGTSSREHRTIAVSDVSKEPRFSREISDSLGFKCRSILAVPILHRGEALGVIELINKLEDNQFQSHEVESVEQVARAAGSLLAIAYGSGAQAAAQG